MTAPLTGNPRAYPEQEIKKVSGEMVSGPVHLEMYLDKCFDPVDMGTIDTIARCYEWLAFSGVPIDDCPLLKGENFDFIRMLIIFKNHEYPIYRESVPCFNSAINLKEIVYYSDNNVAKIYSRDPGEWILRCSGTARRKGQYKGEDFSPKLTYVHDLTRVLRHRIEERRRSAVSDGNSMCKLSYHIIWKSGLFYRCYELERAGVKPALEDMTTKDDVGIATLRRNMRDYNIWKKAFDV